MTDSALVLRADRKPGDIHPDFPEVELALEAAQALVEGGQGSTVCWCNAESKIGQPIMHFRWLGGSSFELDNLMTGEKKTLTLAMN